MFREFWYRICTTCRPNTSRTVRYAFPLIFLAVIFGGAAAAITEDGSHLSLEITPERVTAGEPFFIIVQATAHTPVNAVDVAIEYPETQIEVTGIDTGRSVITLWTEEPSVENGSVRLRGGTFRRGFVGTHEIARLRATAKESGSAEVAATNVRFVAGDGTGEDVALSETGDDRGRVYILNTDGSLVGNASVVIVTDLDGDGDVTFADISQFMSAWFNGGKTYDFNDDGRMNIRDFSIILADSFFK